MRQSFDTFCCFLTSTHNATHVGYGCMEVVMSSVIKHGAIRSSLMYVLTLRLFTWAIFSFRDAKKWISKF